MLTTEELEESFLAEQKATKKRIAKQLALRIAANVLAGVAIHLAVTAIDKKFFSDDEDEN